MDMPFIPEFSNYRERNQWIRDHAQYWTIILRKDRRNYRAERHSLDESIALANQVLQIYPHKSLLIYAVAAGHDTLAATVSTAGVKTHD